MFVAIIAVMPMFLLAACMRWLPPIPMLSPSPITTTTFRSGLDAFKAVAKASALPCRVWAASLLK